MIRLIESEESRRNQGEGLQGIRDSAWIEESGLGGQPMENPTKWHSDLINAWETNLPREMEGAIAINYATLEREKMLGMARLML